MSESRHTKMVRHTRQVRPVCTEPPPGMKKIKNIYWDPSTKEIVVEVDDDG